MDIRERDFVTIEMCVERAHSDWLELRLKPNDVACEKGGGTSVGINLRAIVEHRAHPLQVGSVVKFIGNPDSISGNIRHIIGDQAWVRWPDYDDVIRLDRLERENRDAIAKAEGRA